MAQSRTLIASLASLTLALSPLAAGTAFAQGAAIGAAAAGGGGGAAAGGAAAHGRVHVVRRR